MPKITFIETNGNSIETNAEIGSSLMKVAVSAGVSAIVAECGGSCACGTCHCYIKPDWLNKIASPKEDEVDMLEFVIEPNEFSRLSCQVTITEEMDGLVIQVPETQT